MRGTRVLVHVCPYYYYHHLEYYFVVGDRENFC